MTEPTRFPDWAQPGMKVAIISSYRSAAKVGTVIRHTKTQIVVHTGPPGGGYEENFRQRKYSDGWYAPASTGYYSSPRLADPNSPDIRAQLVKARIESLSSQIRALTSKTLQTGTTLSAETAFEAISQLNEYVHKLAGLTEKMKEIGQEGEGK